MEVKKDTLRDAIAEAKAIREAAIANARESLQESITPHLKEMLAKKLEEMARSEEEEEVVDENINNTEDERELVNNVQEETETPEESEEDETGAEEEETPEGEEPTEEGEELDLAQMDREEFKNLIKDLFHEIQAEESPEGESTESQDDMSIDLDNPTSEEEGEDTIDIDELLAEIAAEEEGEQVQEETQPEASQNDLDEALKTVKNLQKQLNEVNLLNAKLLYVNKIFKDKNLSESQKVNVVVAFEKAETVKEVKLVYETVIKNVGVTKQVVKEHKSFASKPTNTPKKVIAEALDPKVARMQFLAGIK